MMISVTRTDAVKTLENLFLDNGFRIPLKDYSVTAAEAFRVNWFRNLASFQWFKPKVIEVSESEILRTSSWFQELYEEEFLKISGEVSLLEGYQRKRAISRLRYLMARLLHLAPEENLGRLLELAAPISELYFQTRVMEAILNSNIDSILDMGTNAAQVTAQIMKAAQKQAYCNLSELSQKQAAALAVFFFNGVKVNCPTAIESKSELLRFARIGGDAELMRSSDPFLREVSCLHGLTQPRHAHMLETAFDRREALIMDAISTLVSSFSP